MSYTIWATKSVRTSGKDGYVLADTTNGSILQIKPNPTMPGRPAIFLSEMNALIYASEMADIKNDKTLLNMKPVPATYALKQKNMLVYLMSMNAATCKQCGHAIYQMESVSHGQFFDKIHVKCPKCGTTETILKRRPR